MGISKTGTIGIMNYYLKSWTPILVHPMWIPNLFQSLCPPNIRISRKISGNELEFTKTYAVS